MPDYIKYDSGGRITERWISADPSRVVGYDNILEVSRSVIESLTKFHKVENSKVRLMTQAEKDALLQEEAAKQTQELETRTQNLDVSLKEALTALIQVYNSKVPVAYRITKDEIITQIKNNRI